MNRKIMVLFQVLYHLLLIMEVVCQFRMNQTIVRTFIIPQLQLTLHSARHITLFKFRIYLRNPGSISWRRSHYKGLLDEAKTTKDYTPPLDLYIILAGEVLKKLVKVWVGTGQLFEIREDGGIRLIRQTGVNLRELSDSMKAPWVLRRKSPLTHQRTTNYTHFRDLLLRSL